MGIIATEPPPTYRYKDAQELLSEKEPWAIIHIFVLKYLTKKAIDETWPWIEKLEEALPYEQSISQLTKSKSIIEFSVAIQNRDFDKMKQMKEENKGDFSADVNKILEKSIFTTKESVLAFLNNPKPESISTDPLYLISTDLTAKVRAKSEEQLMLENGFEKDFRIMVAGLRESKKTKIIYPDANSTLRLSYGKVRALPADKRNDAKINNYTTMDGMVKKYKAGDAEFDLPSRLLELNKTQDFGKYADKSGYMPINFLTDNDITGGNSGSPVLNGKGELIGVAFDGNIEAMAGDVIFDKNLQRTISLDIRYVLWIIDKYAGAKHIVDEMTIME